uniref:GST_C domain-containing protein n=1 Tax=Anisakis simplex TaxID=6269 RepID=A0A0M3K3F3_ANISI
LYTNIDNEGATQSLLLLLKEHGSTVDPFGFTVIDLELLLTACLGYDVFQFNSSFCEQKRSLATEDRLTPGLQIGYEASAAGRLTCIPSRDGALTVM